MELEKYPVSTTHYSFGFRKIRFTIKWLLYEIFLRHLVLLVSWINLMIMASNIFARYIWLVDTIRRYKRITYDEINDLWKECGLGYGSDLPLRTFHNHRQAIEEIFDIVIECDTKGGYQYYISNLDYLEKDNLRNWLIDSYATLNQIQADRKLEDRIQFEDIPSGHRFLSQIIEAMRKNRVLHITHQGFGKNYSSSFDIEPYCVRVFHRRWYVIARSPYYDKVLTYGLDRIHEIRMTDNTFEIPENFNIDEYFEGCCGIISDKDIAIERVMIKTYAYARDYIATLPIHGSQKEIARDDESVTYEYRVRPTFDFLQALLSQADQIEVLEPRWVRDEMKRFAENILSYYHK